MPPRRRESGLLLPLGRGAGRRQAGFQALQQLLDIVGLGQLGLKVGDLLLAFGQSCVRVTQLRLQACSLVGAFLQPGRLQL